MAHDWLRYCGSELAGRYVLDELADEEGSAAAFAGKSADRDVLVRLQAIEDANAGAQPVAWSDWEDLVHPSLLAPLDSGIAELEGASFAFAVFDKADDNLAEAVDARALTPQEAREVTAAVAAALSHLHRNGVSHGAVTPASIVAVGNVIKLAPPRAGLRAGSPAHDVFSLGGTIVQMLTQQRPESSNNALVNRLPAPFAAIASGCLEPDHGKRWTAQKVADVLDGKASATSVAREVQARPTVQRPLRSQPAFLNPLRIVAGLAAALVVVLFAYSALRPQPQPEPAAAEPRVVLSAPPPVRPSQLGDRMTQQAPPVRTETSQRARTASPKPAPPDNALETGWAVVAAIYRDFDPAYRRAQTMAKKWPSFQPKVVPPKGQGRRYLVVLGSGMVREDAESLLRRAHSSGLPRDAYVTRLSTSAR